MQGRMFRLAEVRILPERGADPLLELADAATLCFEVRDDYTCLPDQARGPVCVAFPARELPVGQNRQEQAAHVMRTLSSSDQHEKAARKSLHAAAGPHVSGRCENGNDGEIESGSILGSHAVCSNLETDSSSGVHASRPNGVRSCDRDDSHEAIEQGSAEAAGSADVSYREEESRRALDEHLQAAAGKQGMAPETEQAVVLYLAAECRALLHSMPTDASQDAALLQSLRSSPAAPEQSLSAADDCCGSADVRSSVGGGQGCSNGGVGGSGVDCRGGGGCNMWRQCRHMQMAVQYRLQRKLLLARVADDLAAQAALLI